MSRACSGAGVWPRRCPTIRRGSPRASRSTRSPRRRAGRVGAHVGRTLRRARHRDGGRRCACASCCRDRSRTSGRRRRFGRRYACVARCSSRRDRSRSANEPEVRPRALIGLVAARARRARLTPSINPSTSRGSNRTALPRCTAQSWPRSTRRWTVRGWTWSSAAASIVVRRTDVWVAGAEVERA
jgi:hypothetical protein